MTTQSCSGVGINNHRWPQHFTRIGLYAAFFPAFTFAHLARCAAAIFLRADANTVRFTGAEAVVLAAGDSFRTFAHRASAPEPFSAAEVPILFGSVGVRECGDSGRLPCQELKAPHQVP